MTKPQTPQAKDTKSHSGKHSDEQCIQTSQAKMKALTIPLSRGLETTVDADDYKELSKWVWHINSNGMGNLYAARTSTIKERKKGAPKTIHMHRSIMSPPKDLMIDHINGNSLDNTKANLRICTSMGNNKNRGKTTKKSSSRFKGVHWKISNKKWTTYIRSDKKKYHIGSFDNEREAAMAYDQKAKELHGEYANLNFPDNEADLAAIFPEEV